MKGSSRSDPTQVPRSSGGHSSGGPPSGRAPSRLPDYLTIAECEQFLEAVDTGRHSARDVALVFLLWGSGARVSEVLGATLQDLRHDSEEDVGILRVLGKGNRQRELMIPPRAWDALVLYLRPRGWPFNTAPEPLFLSQRNKALSRKTVWQLFAKRAASSGIRNPRRVHPHVFRHSCATHMLLAGEDLRTVQIHLGHASVTSTQIYTHLDSAHKKAAARRHPMGDR